MVKKLKAMANKSRGDSQLAGAIKESAHEIWLAGLGAFAKAQEEGQKVFKALVREGSSMQQRTMKATEAKVSDVTGRVNDVTSKVSQVAAGLQKQATGTWDKLEGVFEARVRARTESAERADQSRDQRTRQARRRTEQKRGIGNACEAGAEGPSEACQECEEGSKKGCGLEKKATPGRCAKKRFSPFCAGVASTAVVGTKCPTTYAMQLRQPLLHPNREQPLSAALFFIDESQAAAPHTRTHS